MKTKLLSGSIGSIAGIICSFFINIVLIEASLSRIFSCVFFVLEFKFIL